LEERKKNKENKGDEERTDRKVVARGEELRRKG
jgi:hypothetical protein